MWTAQHFPKISKWSSAMTQTNAGQNNPGRPTATDMQKQSRDLLKFMYRYVPWWDLFSLYTESVMREAEIQDLGYNIGGRNISNARYADDTALIAQSPMEMQQLLDKVNAAGAQRLLKLNVKKTKLMTIGDVPDDITIRVNNDPVEKVKQFKYLGSLKSTDGDCSKDVNARIAMAKRRMCELTTLWKDRSIPVALKMRLVKTLVWTVLSYGAEAWTLKARDERKITSMEMWLWRRMLRISWMTIVSYKNLK